MNHLQTPEYIELRDLILKSEGKTIEDELGRDCFLIHKESELKTYLLKVNNDVWERIDYDKEPPIKRRFLDCTSITPEKYKGWQFQLRTKEIDRCKKLGRPISSDRVLMALGKKSEEPEFDYDINFVHKCSYLCIYLQDQEIECCWTLGQPLHLQPLETIKQLLNILKLNSK